MHNDVRYDRQVRLWGDDGQTCIENASVCVLGASALGCEIIKNLVLAGIKSVHIIDSITIGKPDLGNNFFMDEQFGEPRAKVALKLLMELNPAVGGNYDLRNPEEIIRSDIDFLKQFAVVVASNLTIDLAARINDVLFEENIPFIHARAYGLLGLVRISVREHTIIDTHEENVTPDFRLDCPFPALDELAQSTNLDELSYDKHSHIPYLILFLKALRLWREKYDEDDFPNDRVKRKTFEEIYLSLRMEHPEDGSLQEENFVEGQHAMIRSLKRTVIPPGTRELLDHPKAQEPDETRFWLLVAALRRFVITHDVLPLCGSIPDMISDTESYVRLATKFREKAKEDAEEVMNNACRIVAERHLPDDTIKNSDCEFFCKRAALLKVQHGTTIAQELKSSLEDIFRDLRDADFSPNAITGVPEMPSGLWYILLRAIDRFHSEKSRFPGTNGVPCTIDAYDLKTRIVGLISESNLVDGSEVIEKIPQIAVDEMCRYGAAELHVIASLIGGIVAQEVIKLATHQYIPLDNTLIFNGHTQQAQTYRL